MSPKDRYWLVNINILEEADNGKIKRSKEKHLVDAPNIAEVENKVKEMMDSETRDWSINSISQAGIIEVY